MRIMENSLGKIEEKKDGTYHIDMKMADNSPYNSKPSQMCVIVNLNNGKIECDTESLLHFTRLIVLPILKIYYEHFVQDPAYKEYENMFKQKQIELQQDVKEAVAQQEKMGDLSGQETLVLKALDAILWAEEMTNNFLTAIKKDIQQTTGQTTGLWTKEKFWDFLKVIFKCEEIK